MNIPPLPPDAVGLPPAPVSAHRQVLIAYDNIAAAGRSDVWSTLRAREDVLVEAKAVDERVRAGERFPLAGLLVAVTEHVAGLPRPGGGEPAVPAVAIQRLIQAGAVVLGKTRPCAATRSHVHSSALAVALGLVDVAVATEAPGRGGVDSGVDRVWNGVVGIRPTRGLVPMTGMATAAGAGHGALVFARTVATAQRALVAMTGPDPSDPASRHWPDLVCLAAGERPRVAVADLSSFPGETGRVYQQAISDLLAAGALVETIDITPILEPLSGATAGKAGQGGWPQAWDGYRALVLPAVPGTAGLRPAGHPDLTGLREAAAVTVPYDRAGAWESGLTVLAPPFDDQVALDLAASLTGEQVNEPYPTSGADLVVFGAHLRGQPLNHQLAELGARFRGQVVTAERYRMVALPTLPPTPGIVRMSPGAALAGERWTISPAGLRRFLAGLPEEMAPGEIELEDGSTALGFQCEPTRAAAAKDITAFGDWRAYLRHLTAIRPMVPVR